MNFPDLIWACLPGPLETFLARVQRIEARAEAFPTPTPAAPKTYRVENRTAVLSIRGPILRSVPSWFADYDISASGIDDLQLQLLDAIADEDVDTIHLDVDSPGGTTSGLAELAQLIYEARQHKSITAHTNGLAASAALYLASQADTFTASPGSLIGSIGTLSVVSDWSEAYKAMGAKVHVIKSAPLKGTGTFGASISEAELEHLQTIVDALSADFVSAIARGRNIDLAAAKKLHTGALWVAQEAARFNLIDEVRLSTTTNTTSPAAGETEQTMSKKDVPSATAENTPPPAPAPVPAADELTRLRAELAAAKAAEEKALARAAALDAHLEDQARIKKTQVIDAALADGKITPASKPKYEALAEKLDVKELTELLADLPTLIHPRQSAGAATQNVRALAIDDETIQAHAHKLGLDPAELVAAMQAENQPAPTKGLGLVRGVASIDFRRLSTD